MSWEYEIWQDERFIDAGDSLAGLERPEGSRTILDASMVGPKETVEAIAAAAKHRVQGLILSAATDAMGPALSGIRSLQSLDLTHSGVTDAILPSLTHLEGLSSLALRATQVKGPGLEALLGLRGLRMLDLTQTPLADEALVLVGRMRSLGELWLDGTRVSGEALGALKGLTGLTRLGLAGLEIAPGQLGFLASLVDLQNLDLSGRGAEDPDDAELGLVDGDSDEADDATRRGTTGRGARKAGDALLCDKDLEVIGKLGELRSLSLAGRRGIRGPGLAALAGLGFLDELDLSETQVQAMHLAPLAGLLLARLVLREVPLGSKAKGKAGYAALAASKTLAYLDLAGATLDDAAVESLAACAALEVLVLDHTPVTPKALKAFAGHAVLQTVRFDGYRLDRDQAVAFGRKGRPPAGVKRRRPSGAVPSLVEGDPEERCAGLEVMQSISGKGGAGHFDDEEDLSGPLGWGVEMDAGEEDLAEGEDGGAEERVDDAVDVDVDEGIDHLSGGAGLGGARRTDPLARLQAALFGKARSAEEDEVDGEGEGDEAGEVGDGDGGDDDEGRGVLGKRPSPGGEEPEETEAEAEQSARLLLARLVEAGKVELVDGAKLDDFPDGLGAIISGAGRGEQKAAKVTEWLLEQEDLVEEVYYSDDELGPVLDMW